MEYDPAVPQAAYAARMLHKALAEQGYALHEEPKDGHYLITLGMQADGLDAEAYTITPEGNTITVRGGDERGMIYGALALAEHLRNGLSLEQVEKSGERARLPFRATKHNLPWDS